jgi:hypothetical protein
MKPSRFTEEQIIGILREQEAGAATADVCRKHGISSATFWKAKFPTVSLAHNLGQILLLLYVCMPYLLLPNGPGGTGDDGGADKVHLSHRGWQA